MCGGSDENIDIAGFDQYKYSRSSAKNRRTVICRLSVHQNVNKIENQSEINPETIINDHELTNLCHDSKIIESPSTVTNL